VNLIQKLVRQRDALVRDEVVAGDVKVGSNHGRMLDFLEVGW